MEPRSKVVDKVVDRVVECNTSVFTNIVLTNIKQNYVKLIQHNKQTKEANVIVIACEDADDVMSKFKQLYDMMMFGAYHCKQREVIA